MDDMPMRPNAYGDGTLTSPTKQWCGIGAFGLWWPQKKEQDMRQLSMTYHEELEEGVAQWNKTIGQRCSSTRMELSAWIMALMQPWAVHFATDSASMKSKGDKLIKAAEDWMQEDGENWIYRRNPCGKPWGLQKDGDLWDLVWNALLSRGPKRQIIKKVKGHATQEEVDSGEVQEEDKRGNDIADKLADCGAQEVGGQAFLNVVKWMEKRHDDYAKLISRIQKVIVAVLKKERKVREEQDKVNTITKGYDEKKHKKVNGKICEKDNDISTILVSLNLSPAIRGKHRYRRQQKFYEEMLDFMRRKNGSP